MFYAYITTYATQSEDDPAKTDYYVEGSPVYLDDLLMLDTEPGSLLVFWEAQDRSSLEQRIGTRPDWCGILDQFGDVLRLDARYVDRVVL